MNRMSLRRLPIVTNRCLKIRHFSVYPRQSFISNLFGSKEAKQKEEIIKNQDQYEIDPNSKVVFLNEENAPNATKFDPDTDASDFKIQNWKLLQVKDSDIETTYTSDRVAQIINETYKDLKGESINQDNYESIDLHDLSFRFKFAKSLQQRLGFHIGDYTLTKSHNLGYLFGEVERIINKRWVSERNPNGIVLRKEDFKVPNIYLNEERTPEEQDVVYRELVEKAKASLESN